MGLIIPDLVSHYLKSPTLYVLRNGLHRGILSTSSPIAALAAATLRIYSINLVGVEYPSVVLPSPRRFLFRIRRCPCDDDEPASPFLAEAGSPVSGWLSKVRYGTQLNSRDRHSRRYQFMTTDTMAGRWPVSCTASCLVLLLSPFLATRTADLLPATLITTSFTTTTTSSAPLPSPHWPCLLALIRLSCAESYGSSQRKR